MSTLVAAGQHRFVRRLAQLGEQVQQPGVVVVGDTVVVAVERRLVSVVDVVDHWQEMRKEVEPLEPMPLAQLGHHEQISAA